MFNFYASDHTLDLVNYGRCDVRFGELDRAIDIDKKRKVNRMAIKSK